jgi:acyl carrier protein
MVIASEKIADAIERFIRTEFQIPDNDTVFTRDAHLYDSGFVDSTGVVELIAFVESTFNVKLEDRYLFSNEFTTINGISKVILECLSSVLSNGDKTQQISNHVPAKNIGNNSNCIRPFVRADIPQVADLHRRVFLTEHGTSPQWLEFYQTYFNDVFLNHPYFDESSPSLVYQEHDGRIVGFLGVITQPMSMNGKPLHVALGSQFIVDPDSRSKLVAIQLSKALFSSPQDLFITDEANDTARQIWEGLGGTTALLYSIHWTRPLRPCQLALFYLKRRKHLMPLAQISRPFAWIADTLVTRIPQSPFHQSPPKVGGEALNDEMFLRHLPEFANRWPVRPEYDHRLWKWAVDRASQRKDQGDFQKVVVKGEKGDIAGWYLYYLNPGKVGEVLQICAKDHSIHRVLDHLFYHAWRQGMVAVTGRFEPRFIQAFSDRSCLLHGRGPWMLVHSKNSEILQAFCRGDAFFSRLEGEWCLHFQ